MKTYLITTKYGTIYEIDSDGCFLRYNQHTWKHPHDTWKCTGCAKILPFGNWQYLDLETFLSMIENNQITTFKNGNSMYTLTDMDNGTHRRHGNGILFTNVI